MAKAKYLIDTAILLDHFNGITQATDWLSSLLPGEAVISVITRAEVLAGASAGELPALKLFLSRYPCLQLDLAIADVTAVLRQTRRWKLPDAFQAALAQRHRLLLVTRNTNDFPAERFEFVMVPYHL